MKKYLSFMAFAMVMAASLSLSSCGSNDDDDGGGDGKITSKMFVGSWVESSGDRKWVLKSNGQCDYYVLEGSGSGRNVTFSLKLNSSGTWRYNEAVQTLTVKTNKVGFTYTIVDADYNSWTCRNNYGNYVTWTRE